MALSTHLHHHWTMAFGAQPGSPLSLLIGKKIMSAWKPVVWLCKGHQPAMEFINPDLYISPWHDRRKDLHPWQQPQPYFDLLVRSFTRNYHHVCDPMLGWGTTALSCLKHRRRFTGIECHAERFAIARQRINEAAEAADPPEIEASA